MRTVVVVVRCRNPKNQFLNYTMHFRGVMTEEYLYVRQTSTMYHIDEEKPYIKIKTEHTQKRKDIHSLYEPDEIREMTIESSILTLKDKRIQKLSEEKDGDIISEINEYLKKGV